MQRDDGVELGNRSSTELDERPKASSTFPEQCIMGQIRLLFRLHTNCRASWSATFVALNKGYNHRVSRPPRGSRKVHPSIPTGCNDSQKPGDHCGDAGAFILVEKTGGLESRRRACHVVTVTLLHARPCCCHCLTLALLCCPPASGYSSCQAYETTQLTKKNPDHLRDRGFLF